MDATKTLARIQSKKEKKQFLRRFNRYKRYVLKLYPDSELRRNSVGKFYIVDSNGRRLLREEYRIPDCDTPYDTWENTYSLLWSSNLIERNTRKFSDDKIITSSEK